MQYLGRYRRVAVIAYAALFISTGAQLMVPRLVSNIIDRVTTGTTANMILGLPPQEIGITLLLLDQR